jgi:Ca2+-binding RTX toxin-like protein
VVRGERGRDRVRGGRGADTVDGGLGGDRLYGDPDADNCISDILDVFIRTCEGGNYKQITGNGDRLFRPRLTSGFAVAEQCFEFTRTCDKFYVARIRLNGAGSFDALSVDAFNSQGETIASYGDAADEYGGVFMFGERPIQLQVDSGGGAWEVMFYHASGVRTGAATTSGSGNQVYFVKRPVRGQDLSASVDWTGFGHFAVVAVAPSNGRDLLVNEVRFSGQGNPPFAAEAPAASNISIVQVLSDSGNWTVAIG